MNTFTIEELDREEIELLPFTRGHDHVQPGLPAVLLGAVRPTIQVCLKVRLCCLVGVGADVRA